MSDVEHHALTTDSGRIGQASSQEGMAGIDESRLGECPECEQKVENVPAHLAEEHPDWTVRAMETPDDLRAAAAELRARADSYEATAKANEDGGTDYGVEISDGVNVASRVS